MSKTFRCGAAGVATRSHQTILRKMFQGRSDVSKACSLRTDEFAQKTLCGAADPDVIGTLRCYD